MDFLSGFEDVSYCPEEPKDPMGDGPPTTAPSGMSFPLPNHLPLVAPNPNPYLTDRQSLAIPLPALWRGSQRNSFSRDLASHNPWCLCPALWSLRGPAFIWHR